jgi:hypothetical protein
MIHSQKSRVMFVCCQCDATNKIAIKINCCSFRPCCLFKNLTLHHPFYHIIYKFLSVSDMLWNSFSFSKNTNKFGCALYFESLKLWWNDSHAFVNSVKNLLKNIGGEITDRIILNGDALCPLMRFLEQQRFVHLVKIIIKKLPSLI